MIEIGIIVVAVTALVALWRYEDRRLTAEFAGRERARREKDAELFAGIARREDGTHYYADVHRELKGAPRADG